MTKIDPETVPELGERPFRPCPKPERTPRQRRSKRSLSAWRDEVLERDHYRCRSCGLTDRTGAKLSAHHVIFKSHCRDEYVDDRRNGVTLCNEWGRACHQRLHAVQLRLSPWMLPREVIECCAEQGLTWDEEGVPTGTLCVYFGRELRRGGKWSRDGAEAGSEVGGGSGRDSGVGGGTAAGS